MLQDLKVRQVAHQVGAYNYSSSSTMKWHGVSLLVLDGMLLHCRVDQSRVWAWIWILRVNLSLWVILGGTFFISEGRPSIEKISKWTTNLNGFVFFNLRQKWQNTAPFSKCNHVWSRSQPVWNDRALVVFLSLLSSVTSFALFSIGWTNFRIIL